MANCIRLSNSSSEYGNCSCDSIPCSLTIHVRRLELTLKQSPGAIISFVDGFGVGNGEALHAAREMVTCLADQQLIVMGHEAVDNHGAELLNLRQPGVWHTSGIFVSQQTLADPPREKQVIFSHPK